jgi:hypothetical protein
LLVTEAGDYVVDDAGRRIEAVDGETIYGVNDGDAPGRIIYGVNDDDDPERIVY